MSYLNQQILHSLRQARMDKGLSQRALSERSGVPQGHISKIERGAVDLRASSLIALARVLELELVLAPKPALPAISALTRNRQNPQTDLVPAAYRLDDDEHD